MSALVIVTPAAAGPVSLAEAKSHLRVDSTADDVLISALLDAVTAEVEDLTARKLVTQTWKWFFDAFPEGDTLLFPVAPLASVTHVKTYDQESPVNATTFAATSYVVDTSSAPARLVLRSGSSWPSDPFREANGIEVQFVSGYGAATAVPERIKLAIKIWVAHLYENREALAPVALQKIPLSVESLLGEFSAWNKFGHAGLDPQ